MTAKVNVMLTRSFAGLATVLGLASGSAANEIVDWADCNGVDSKRAIDACTRIIGGRSERFPLVDAYGRRAVAHGRLKKLDLAIQDFGKVIELSPKNPSGYKGRATAYTELNRLKEALADLDTAISLNAADASLFGRRGQVHKRMGSVDRALADYSRAIALDRQDILALMSRSGIYRQKREFSKALADCKAADRIFPDPSKPAEMAASIGASVCKNELKIFDAGPQTEQPPAAPTPKRKPAAKAKTDA